MKFSSSPNRPANWKAFKLRDVCKTFTSGGTPSRKKPQYFQNGTIPWVRTKELKDGLINQVEEYITEEALKNSSAKILPKNTVLLAMYGATVGKLGILMFESACNQACAAMVTKEGVADFRYLFYLLLNHRDLIISQATGGAQQNLSGEQIKDFMFDFPPFGEQLKIADVLWSIDEKIYLNEKLSKTLEDIAQTIFKSWFIDFDPVKAKMNGEKPIGMDDETAALFPNSFEESELGLIPEGWEVKSASELFEIGIGRTPPRKEPEWFCGGGEGIPWVSIRDMGTFETYSRETNEALTPDAVNRFKVPLVPENTVLMSFKLTVGKLCITDRELVTNEAIAHFRITDKSPIESFYTYLWLNNIEMGNLDSTSSIGTATNSGVLKQIKFLVPTKRVLDCYLSTANPIFHELKVLSRQSRNLIQIRDSLLPRLISGELQVPEEMLAS